jgi:hypothetical protein
MGKILENLVERIDPRSRMKSGGLTDAVRHQLAPLLVGKVSGVAL